MDTSSNVIRHSPTNSATVDQTIGRPQTSAGNPADDLSVSTTPPSQDELKRTARRESFHLHQSFDLHKQEAQASFLDAVAKGDVEAVRRCKGNTLINVNARQVRDGVNASPLGHAIFRHDKEMVDALLEIGANPLLPPTDDADKRDPAWHAMSEGQPDIFASLIRKEPKILSPERQPPLLTSYVMHVAKQRATLKAATENENPKVMHVRQHELYMEKDKPEVIKAHQQKLEGQIKIGKMILDEAPVSGEALITTVKNKDFETFEQLVKSGKFTPTAKGGTRADHQAVDPDLDFHLYPIMNQAMRRELPASYLELCLKHAILPVTEVTASHLQTLKRRLKVDKLEPKDIPPAPALFAMQGENLEVLNALKNHGVGPDQLGQGTPLGCAVTHGIMMQKPVLFKFVLENNVDLNRKVILDPTRAPDSENTHMPVYTRLETIRDYMQDFLAGRKNKVPEAFRMRYETFGGAAVNGVLSLVKKGLLTIDDHKKQQQSAG